MLLYSCGRVLIVLLARVAGQVWGARQAEGLRGWRLLVLHPLHVPGHSAKAATGWPLIHFSADQMELAEEEQVIVAVDNLGAGPGELVLVAHGSRCRDLELGEAVPTKDVVVAIVDEGVLDLAAHPGKER